MQDFIEIGKMLQCNVSAKRPTNAKKANALGYDAVHDTVYEMVKDEVILYSKEKYICFIMHAHKID